MKLTNKKIIVGILGVALTSVLVWAGTALKITEQPEDQTAALGDSVTFSVKADGDSDISMDMVWCPAGTFTMGSPSGELGRWDNETQHSVTISHGFWIGKYGVTQAQYKTVMGNNPSYFSGDNNPVECVRWYDAMSFCEKLTAQEKAAGRLPEGYEFTLPTEAQWEYACRAGTTTAFNNGTNIPTEEQRWDEPCPNLDPIGWYWYNSGSTTHPVGQKRPNNWGIYDMHGNVWEWCLDWYPGYEGSDRVIRGGSWSFNAAGCRLAYRSFSNPGCFWSYGGFRVALSPVQSGSGGNYGNSSLTYQWYKDGIAINGATSSSYTISKVKKSDEGSYTVTVSDGTTSVTSRAAKLTLSTLSIKMHQVSDSRGYQNATASAGADEPLIPLASETSLGSHLKEVSQGLVADGVTPLVFSVKETGQTTENHTYTIKLVSKTSGGSSAMEKLYVLNNGKYVQSNQLTIKAHPQGDFTTYFYLGAIKSEDISTSVSEVGYSIEITSGTGSEALATQEFKIRRPPIVLDSVYTRLTKR